LQLTKKYQHGAIRNFLSSGNFFWPARTGRASAPTDELARRVGGPDFTRMNFSALLNRHRLAILRDRLMSNSLILTTFVSSGQHETQKQKFDGTKLPIVAGRHQTTIDSVNSRFSKGRLVAQLALRLGNSGPIRSRLRDCAMRNRSAAN
jgi:hypothetical protein